MQRITQAPAQFYRRQEKDKIGREIRAIGNPKKATNFELFSDLFILPGETLNRNLFTAHFHKRQERILQIRSLLYFLQR